MPTAHGFFPKLWRKKYLEVDISETELRRCMTIFNLILLGITMVSGGGIYVVIGVVAHNFTCPALFFLLLLIAGFTHSLTALYFTNCASRITKTYALYIYTFITLGGSSRKSLSLKVIRSCTRRSSVGIVFSFGST